jgi:DNA polymerase III subunit alpha
VVDPETRMEVQMLSRRYRVAASNEFFNQLKVLPSVSFSLN